MKTSQLILYYAVSKIGRFVLRPLCLLPVRQKRVLFLSFRGKQYSCNPRAISEELAKQAGGKMEIIWAFHAPAKFRFLESQGIRVISDHGFRFILAALTARVVCTNTYYKPYLPRRRKQFYLRTWHGGGAYKKVDYPEGLMGTYIRMQQEGANLYLSSSRAFTALTLKDSFGYKGEVLEKGMPRNDALFNGEWRSMEPVIRHELILDNKKIAVYAPTYRESDRQINAPDADMLKKALETRFGGEFILLFRGHHVSNHFSFQAYKDVSDYFDMQPLLIAADVLITDYSSSIWDMSLTGKPVFLYCPDLKEYERSFYTDIRKWPFPMSEDSEALQNNILHFDENSYAKAIKSHHEILGSCETGRASRIAARRIMKECSVE